MQTSLLPCLTLVSWCAAQAQTEPLLGTVLAPDGTPVVGARVEVWRAEGRGMNLLDLDYNRTYRRIGVVLSDRRGRFALHLPVGLPCRVRVDQAPHAIWMREDFQAGEDVPVQLEVPAVFEGRLTLADGSPARAELRARNRDTSDEVLRGRTDEITDEEGRFRFARVPAGPIRVEVSADAAPSPSWADVQLIAGETVTHDVQLARGVRLHGRVGRSPSSSKARSPAESLLRRAFAQFLAADEATALGRESGTISTFVRGLGERLGLLPERSRAATLRDRHSPRNGCRSCPMAKSPMRSKSGGEMVPRGSCSTHSPSWRDWPRWCRLPIHNAPPAKPGWLPGSGRVRAGAWPRIVARAPESHPGTSRADQGHHFRLAAEHLCESTAVRGLA